MSSKIQEFDGAVALLDALGTRNRWINEDPQMINEKWDRLINGYERDFKTSHPLLLPTKPTIRAFSDTVIITTKGTDMNDALRNIAIDTNIFFQEALMNEIPFLGCISVGKIFQGEKMILGPAINEAVEYFKLPNWVGVSACPSAYKLLESQLQSGENISPFVRYDIPLKTGIETNGFALNYKNSYQEFLQLIKEYPPDMKYYKETPDSPEKVFQLMMEKTLEINGSF